VIRLIGILTGSALAVAAIVMTFGLPELTPTAAVAVPEFVPQPEATPNIDVNIVASSDEALPAATVTEDISAPLTETVAAPVAEIAVDPVAPAPAARPSQNWYAFWSPFRSEIAADGFISELQRTTGLDYRVVELKPGVYEVAFAYSNPLDRDTKLDRIAAATGLDMSGG
jgi:hypothetical protein